MIAPCFGAPAVGDAVTQAGEARRRRRTTCLRGWRGSICRDTGIPRTLAPTTNVSRGSPRVPNAHPVETAPRDVICTGVRRVGGGEGKYRYFTRQKALERFTFC